MVSHGASLQRFKQQIPVPADHQDPNHPHYPGDLEHQSTTRPSLLSKKGFWIAGGVLMTSLSIIAAAFWGVALTRNHDNTDMKAQKIINSTEFSARPTLEIQTVFEHATTYVYSTTRVPLFVAPSLVTSTIILPPTPRAEVAPEAPHQPTQVEPSSATAISEALAPTNDETGDILQSTKCLFSGAWALKEQCEKHCPAWAGHISRCEVSKRSQWVCVSCLF